MTCRSPLALIPVLLLGGCLSAIAQSEDSARVRIGQTASVGLVHVTPIQVIEDSRCPINARCVWAGRTRLSVKIDLGSRSEIREIGSDG